MTKISTQLPSAPADSKYAEKLPIVPLIRIDQEGGTAQRIHQASFIHETDVPSMWKVGQTG
ncbi:MAG TPA: hypothetical protein DEP60_01150 [Ruminococcaceae bacterium]|nr:hypothetical protein [Oscillospiraceae bacterium]